MDVGVQISGQFPDRIACVRFVNIKNQLPLVLCLCLSEELKDRKRELHARLSALRHRGREFPPDRKANADLEIHEIGREAKSVEAELGRTVDGRARQCGKRLSPPPPEMKKTRFNARAVKQRVRESAPPSSNCRRVRALTLTLALALALASAGLIAQEGRGPGRGGDRFSLSFQQWRWIRRKTRDWEIRVAWGVIREKSHKWQFQTSGEIGLERGGSDRQTLDELMRHQYVGMNMEVEILLTAKQSHLKAHPKDQINQIMM
jgi:hypothetical protein